MDLLIHAFIPQVLAEHLLWASCCARCRDLLKNRAGIAFNRVHWVVIYPVLKVKCLSNLGIWASIYCNKSPAKYRHFSSCYPVCFQRKEEAQKQEEKKNELLSLEVSPTGLSAALCSAQPLLSSGPWSHQLLRVILTVRSLVSAKHRTVVWRGSCWPPIII